MLTTSQFPLEEVVARTDHVSRACRGDEKRHVGVAAHGRSGRRQRVAPPDRLDPIDKRVLLGVRELRLLDLADGQRTVLEHGVEVVGMFFFEDNNYVLIKGDPLGERLAKVAKDHEALRRATLPTPDSAQLIIKERMFLSA